MGSKGSGTSTQNQQQFQNQTQNQQNASATTQNQLVNTNQTQTGTQGQTQNQQGTSTYNPYAGIMSAGNQALEQARQAASAGFQLPEAPVAGFSNDQQQAFQQYRDLQGAATPYFNQAQGLFNQSAAPISASQINQYMNPYASSILANLHESQHQQMNDMTGRATQTAGGVGADRIGVAQGEMARQQALAEGQTLSGIYGSALSAAQQDAGRQQSAAYGLGNLGGAYQNSLMQGAGALGAAGAQQQQLQQAQLNAPYQNQLARLALPYQQAQFLSGITGGLAGALGGTTSTNQTGNTLGQTTNNTIGQTTGQNVSNTLGQTQGQTSGNTLGYGQSTPAPPNMFSQLAGLGTAGAGLYGALNQNGVFGGGEAYGSGNGEFGGSSNNPLPGLSASDYGAGYARGGYADGGGDVSGDESWMSADPTVPEIHAHPSQGHHPDVPPLNMRPLPSSQAAPMPAMNFAQPETKSPNLKWLDMRPAEQQKSGSSDSGFLGGLGSIIGTAAKIIPLLAQGGAVGSTPYQHFDEGGDVSFDDRFNDSATMGEMRRPQALNYYFERQGRPSPPTSYIPPEEAPLPRERPAEASPRADIPEVYRAPSQEGMNNWHNGKTADLQLNARDAGIAPPPPQKEPTGLGAISPAAAQLAAQNKQQMLGSNYDVPYGDLNHTQDTSRNFAKSPWMALISAGAGMMASGSPYLGVGIGKGLQAGVENLNKQRESSREEETVNQRAKQLAIQADKHLREYTQLTPAQVVAAEKEKYVPAGSAMTPSGELHPLVLGTTSGKVMDAVTGQSPNAADKISPIAKAGQPDPSVVRNIVQGIKSGQQPPVLTGLYRASPEVRAGLHEEGFDLAKAQVEWQRAQKQVATLNGPQMTRFVGLAGSVDKTIDEVKALSKQMNNSGVPLLNAIKLAEYSRAEGNSPNGQLAAKYVAAVNTLKEEFANLANGGYAPTEPAWKLANEQINGNYGVQQLGSSLDEVQRLIRYRIQGIPGLATLGAGAGNRYTGETGEANPAAPHPAPAPPVSAAPPAGNKPAAGSKPATVIQNGHSYTLQPDGSYK